MIKTRTLGTIVAALAYAVSLAGCSQPDLRGDNYSGKVLGDSVAFVASPSGIDSEGHPTYTNTMTIYKYDGREIQYIDNERGDRIIDEIRVMIPIKQKEEDKGNWLTNEDKEQPKNEFETMYGRSNQAYEHKNYSSKTESDRTIIVEGQNNWNRIYPLLQEQRISEGKRLVK